MEVLPDPISSAADSHAPTSVLPARGQGSTDHNPDCGRSSRESLATYDLATSSWRTRQLSLFGGLTGFSGTWPRSGMTRNGIVYPLPSSGPIIPRLEFSLSDLGVKWYTPTVNDAKNSTLPPSQMDRESLVGQLCRMGFAGQQLNPRFVEELMGFPVGWTDCEDSETPSSPPSPSTSGD
jgi:hypothetical protein